MQRLAIAVLIAVAAHAAFADPCERAVELELDTDGAWLATGSDQSCFGSNGDWLRTELASFTSKTCPLALTVRVAANVSFQVAIDAMSRVRELGGTIALAAFDDARRFGTRPPMRRAPPAHCKPPHDAAPQPSSLPLVQPTRALPAAPMIAVSRTELFVNGRSIVKLEAVLKRDRYTIDELVAALPKPAASKGVAIIAADTSTDARVINLIVYSAKAAGYDNLLFAVQ
jgi:biopolymer transport protein ExbD